MAVNQWPVTFSIGAVSFNNPLDTPEDMIKAASNVMQSSAKQGGKDRVQHVTFESREKLEYLVKCSNCGSSFVATSHPFCPSCGSLALADSAPEKATATESKRAAGICAFQLPLECGKVIEFCGPADITREETDAVVSATISSLRGGGDLERAIRRAGGPAIRAECEQIVAKVGRLAEGKAVITTGGKLPAKYVVHTVAPFYRDGNHGEARLLASCYRESIRVAEDLSLIHI